ncbi:MAG TPA: hypothetical protein VGK67_08340 [Myxococcales bacterium]|jgi:hypothetical protein
MRTLLISLASLCLASTSLAAAAEPDPLAPVVPEKAEAKPAAKKAPPKAAAKKAEPKPAAKKADPEPAKEEAAKADTAKPAAEPAKEPAKEPAAEDQAKAEPAKVEPAKEAPAKEPAKAEAAKPAPAKAEPAKPKGPKGKPPPPPPVLAYVVPYVDPTVVGPACDEACVKSAAARLRGRAGVKKVTVEGMSIVLEVQPGVFKPGDVLRGLEGMKVEMRPPYKSIELHFTADGPFPPVSRLENDVLIIEIDENARKALETAARTRVPMKFKCMGKLAGADVYEAVMTRYEEEKRPPMAMVPFMAEADVDGDKRPDLYLRLEGIGELVVFNPKEGELKALVIKEGDSEALPRCDATPMKFVRAVPKQKVKCMTPTPHSGDAIERVQLNKSNELLLFNAGKFATCEPLGEGAMPTVPRPKGPAAKKEDTKKKAEEEW